MKDSGIEWIGMIPEGWEVCRLKNVVACHDELRKPISADKRENHLKLYDYYGASGVIDTIDDYNVDGTVLLIGEDGANLKLRNLPLIYRASGKFWVNNHAHILIVNKKYSYDYVAYLLEAGDYSNYITGSAQPKLSQFNLMRFPVAIPNYTEQENISFFIHRECSKIDSILSETRSSIEEYKKLKQAVITQAVTKGVRGEREMKDSGVEWIGEIPAAWDVAKAKYCVTITHGSDPKTEGSIPVYGSGAESFKTCGEYKEGPTVLIGRKGATLHIPHYIEGKYWNVDTAFDVKAKNNFSLLYYYYLATSFDYKFYIAQTTLPGMTQSNYYNMFLPFPTFPEQEEIVNYLDAKCAEIDKLIAKKEQLVKELEIYKKSLIYEVVTGKREV